MNTRKRIVYRESWAKIRNEISFLATHPEVGPEGWIRLIQKIARNEQRFLRKTKWPKARTVVEEFGHLPAKDFGEKYFTQAYHLASMAMHGGRTPSERWVLSQCCGDIMVIAGLKLVRIGALDNPPPRRTSKQGELFPKKTSN